MTSKETITRIGLFDSGIGGLTILQELLALPCAEFVYVGDTINIPYGQKTPEQIIQFSTAITQFLITQNIDALAIACHTSSAIALPHLQKQFPDIFIIGTIKETMLQVTEQTKNGRVGIMATQASINSHLHKKELLAINPDLEIFEMACPKLVPLIESSAQDGTLIEQALHEYLIPLIKEDIDTLILGCTHYPLLTQEIKNIVGNTITLISSGSVMAQNLQEKIESFEGQKKINFYTTSNPKAFEHKASFILGQPIKAKCIDIHAQPTSKVEIQTNLSNTT